MTEAEQQKFNIGDKVGYYGLPGKVVKHYRSKDDSLGIVIQVAQPTNEIKAKTQPKEYIITDAKMVLHVGKV